jgi:cation:H+ antiporter
MSGLPTGVLILIFVAAAVATWIAGIKLAAATDVIDDAYGLGEALGGLILLSIVGSLPELAITVSAAASGNLGIAAGNLIGGVAMQTLVLAIADRCVRGARPLSALASSLIPALEGSLVIAVVGVTMMSGLLPESAAIGRVGVGSIAIVAIWLVGMMVLDRARDRPDLRFSDPGVPTAQSEQDEKPTKHATRRALVVFGVGAVVTLFAGVMLEESGSALADHWGISGVIFGATVLAGATALPEISSGIEGVRLHRYTLVFGDMFGGNAFQLTLFLVADLIAGQPVLPTEGAQNAFIAGTGLVMTAVYVGGLILRPKRRYLGLGPDSWVAVLVYALGVWGLTVVTK